MKANQMTKKFNFGFDDTCFPYKNDLVSLLKLLFPNHEFFRADKEE